MNAPRPLVGSLVRTAPRPASTQWTARKDRRPSAPVVSVPYTRRYDVTWIDADGFLHDFSRVAPAMPIFESAFNALAHGALVATPRGPVAVEDLVPGMMVETATGEPARLRWVGSITLVPNAPDRGHVPDRLYRIVSDSFGLARPALDVTLGPGARLVDRSPEVCRQTGTEAALAPISTRVDGECVVEIRPAAAVRLYHLSFDAHRVIYVNGLEVESFHPGPEAVYSLSNEMREQFMALFPHKRSLGDFGRMLWPRFEATVDA